jgi:hypothetical protein
MTNNGNGNGNGNGSGNGNGHPQAQASANGNTSSRGGGQRQATQSQVKAIYAIARNRRIDVAQFLSERFRVDRADDLTVKEASKVIDELKELSSAEGSR